LCLFLKMLQIQPDEDVILEYIKQPDLKYLRALGAAYYRISQRHADVYKTLEPLYADYRKLRYRDLTGKMTIIHMDEFIDWLFREKTVCDVTMPGLPKREFLEATLDLPPRDTVLEDDLADIEDLEPVAPGTDNFAASPSMPSDGIAADAADHATAPRAVSQPQEQSKDAVSAKRARSRSPQHRGEARGARAQRSGGGGGSSSSSNSCAGADASASAGRHVRREKKRSKKEARDKKGKKDKRKGEKRVRDGPRDVGNVDVDRKANKPKKDKDGLSVEEWNDIRKGMGLKPLKV